MSVQRFVHTSVLGEGDVFVRGVVDDARRHRNERLGLPGEDTHDEPEPKPPRFPAGVRQSPPRPSTGSAWLRALYHEFLTTQPIDPHHFEWSETDTRSRCRPTT